MFPHKLLRNKKPKINFHLFFHELSDFVLVFHFLGYKDFLHRMVVHINFELLKPTNMC